MFPPRSLSRFGVRLLVLIALLVFAGSAAAAGIKGKLILGAYKPAPPPSEAVRPLFYWELENGFKEVAKNRVNAENEIAVVLLGKTKGEDKPDIEIAFSGGGLRPATVVVKKGTTLRIRNKDEIAHELYAVDKGGIQAEATSPRAIRSIHLDKAGSWALRDRLITHLRAHLHVLPNLAAVATVKANGEFAFDGVAPGKYTLKVFHGSTELASRPVEVAEDGAMTLDPITLTTPPATKKDGK
jgi:hypothetical protein